MSKSSWTGVLILSLFLCCQQSTALGRSQGAQKTTFTEFVADAKKSYQQQDTASAFYFYDKALQVAIDNNDVRAQAEVIVDVGDIYYQYGAFAKAYKQYDEAHGLAVKNQFIDLEARSLKGLSHIEWRTGDNLKSVQNILQSVDKYKSLNDTLGIIEASDVLAGIYVSMGKFDDAFSVYSNSLQLAKAAGDSSKLAQAYEYFGIIAFFKENYEAAISHYERSLAINTAIGEPVKVGINYANIGEALDYQGNHNLALDYFQQALAKLSKHHFNSGLVFVYYGLGRTYTNLGKLQLGLESYKKSLEMIELTGEVREKPQVYNLMAENYTQKQDFQLAYHYYKLGRQVKDSIDNVDKNRQIESIKTKFEVREKERENEQLAMANESKQQDLQANRQTILFQTILLILLVVFMSILGLLFVKLRQQKRELNQANDTKAQLLNIIGHDLRGPIGNLKSIMDLILEKKVWGENKELREVVNSVKDDINKSYFLLNDVLNWAEGQKEGIQLNTQCLQLKDQIDKALDLAKTNAKSKQIKLVNKVDPESHILADENVLQTILRNLLSNAIKFSEKGSEVMVRSEINGKDRLLIGVEDRGVGISDGDIKKILSDQPFTTMGTDEERGVGIGLSICKQFIQQSGSELSIISTPGGGSTFQFSLPFANQGSTK